MSLSYPDSWPRDRCEECDKPFFRQGAGFTRKRFCSPRCVSQAKYHRNETAWRDNPDGTGGVIGALIESGEAIALVIETDQLESGSHGRPAH